MSTFVLIPGAWLGAWVWHPVAERLRALGHRVHALTLTGLDSPSAPPAPSSPTPSSYPSCTPPPATAPPSPLPPPSSLASSAALSPSTAFSAPGAASSALSLSAASSPAGAASPAASATASAAISAIASVAASAAFSPAAEVDLATHVGDILRLLDSADAHDAVLVAHSYAGIVAGQVAGVAPERVAHTVFVDANLPVDGQSMTDGWSARGQALVRAAVAANDGWWPVPELEEFDGHDLTDEQVSWLVAHAVPHPGRTLFQPATLPRPLATLSATYITCLRPDPKPRDDVLALHGQPTWSFADLDTGHWPMLSQPDGLTALLTTAACA